ncbi:MAG: hypothetical protein FJX75_20660 [Armatimonadetes bacterium]|nr:hypothetical protein [Armatimonadota bacterium]
MSTLDLLACSARWLAIGVVLLCASACAQEQPRLLDSMEDPSLYTPAQPELGHRWTGSLALETADCKEGQGCLRFHVQSARSDAESYPQWGRSLDPGANDWSGYQALRYWVKVESEDPTVTNKAMCIVVYNGDSPLQQFVRHTVPVGRWVQLTDNLMTYNRDRVRGIIIYLYETNPAWKDNYTWLVDGLELLPMPAGALDFDGRATVVEPRPLAKPLRPLSTADGLGLSLDSRGRVADVRVGDANVSPKETPLSGLLIRDWRAGETVEVVEGAVRRDGGALEQTASLAQGLQVNARYWSEGKRIRCRVRVRDEVEADRPLTLYFAVPVDAQGWTWWDDIQGRRTIADHGEYYNNPSHTREPRVSPYPFCCLSNEKTALSLAVPLEPPRIQHMVYNASLRVLFIAYEFCLSPAATKQKQTAEFEFALFRSDPRWGFRDTVAQYYADHPDDFAKRIPRDGGWGCWGTYAGNANVPELGFQYHWGPDSRGGAETFANATRFDNEHGYFSFPYIEWTNMHVTMEGYESAGNAEIMERVRFIADPKRTDPLPRWGYCFPYDERVGPDYDGWMRTVFQAYLTSLIYDRDGLLYGGADKSEFGLLAAKYIPFNADPDIPGGAGEFFLTKWRPAIEKYYADNGVHLDGFGWDNFYVRGQAFDYRREHFAYADEPLLFDPLTLQPVILKDMATYELQKRLVESLRAEGRYLIANQGTISPVPATLALLDIFGYEWNIGNTAAYARTMAHHKPVCSLPCAPDHYRDPYVREHLLYGAWPGGYFSTSEPEYLALMRKYIPIVRRLNAAGWEPVTLARTDDQQVQIERFGGGERELLFTLRNNGDEDKTVHASLDAALGLTGALRATELVSGEALAAAPQGFSIQAPAKTVIVVAAQAGG